MLKVFVCKELNFEKIPCIISDKTDPLDLKSIEIYENLARRKLHYIDEGDLLNELKKIRKERDMDATRGGDHKSNDFKIKTSLARFDKKSNRKSFYKDEYYSFSEVIHQKTNLGIRTIQEDIQIAESIIPEVKDFIKEKKIPKKVLLNQKIYK